MTDGGQTLLQYREWKGDFRSPLFAILSIARVGLKSLLRRKMFWVLYSSSLLLFFMFFFGTYLLAFAETQLAETPIRIGRFAPEPHQVMRFLRQALQVLNGSRETFRYFFSYLGPSIVILLALVGSTTVCNDFNFRTIPFYLSKAIGRWHYVAGKCLSTFVVVHMVTTLPALALFCQHALDDWSYAWTSDYFADLPNAGPSGWRLLVGMLGFTTVASTVLSVAMVAGASLFRGTMPFVFGWVSLFFFPRVVANLLVDGLKLDARWRLLDLWNNIRLTGNWCLGVDPNTVFPRPQPDTAWAAATLLGVVIACMIVLNRQIRSVEVVR